MTLYKCSIAHRPHERRRSADVQCLWWPALQLAVPMCDDGQLIFRASGGLPVLCLSTNAVHYIFRHMFSVKCFPSIVLLRNVLHFRDGEVSRQQGHFFVAEMCVLPGGKVMDNKLVDDCV